MIGELPPSQLAAISARVGREVQGWLEDHVVENYYSAADAAELLGVSVRTVWEYVRAGERSEGKEGIFPVAKLSFKCVRIPASSINRFLKSRTVAIPGRGKTPTSAGVQREVAA